MTSTDTSAPAATASRSARYLESLPPLLIEHVTPGDVLAIATDQRGVWRVAWRTATGWRCTCPAKSTACGHIAAVRQLVVVDVDQAEDPGTNAR